jgi:hypothetical protein
VRHPLELRERRPAVVSRDEALSATNSMLRTEAPPASRSDLKPARTEGSTHSTTRHWANAPDRRPRCALSGHAWQAV